MSRSLTATRSRPSTASKDTPSQSNQAEMGASPVQTSYEDDGTGGPLPRVDVDFGIGSVGVNGKGSIDLDVSVPTGTPINVTGGVTLNPMTGEWEETRVGAELGRIGIGIEGAVSGCDVSVTASLPLGISVDLYGARNPICGDEPLSDRIPDADKDFPDDAEQGDYPPWTPNGLPPEGVVIDIYLGAYQTETWLKPYVLENRFRAEEIIKDRRFSGAFSSAGISNFSGYPDCFGFQVFDTAGTDPTINSNFLFDKPNPGFRENPDGSTEILSYPYELADETFVEAWDVVRQYGMVIHIAHTGWSVGTQYNDGSPHNPVIRAALARFPWKEIGRCVYVLDPEIDKNKYLFPDKRPRRKPPKPPRKPPVNQCCPSNTRMLRETQEKQDENNDILKRILQLLEELHKSYAPGEFKGMTIPGSLRNPKETGQIQPRTLPTALDFIAEALGGINRVLDPGELKDASIPKRLIYPGSKGQEKIENYPELLKAIVLQIDKAVGMLPLKVKVGDTNPGKAGNQPVTVEIQSFSDVAKTMIELLLDTEGDGDAHTNLLVRILYECGLIHQITAVNSQVLDNVEQHLDYKVKHKKVDLPMSFNPNAAGKGFEKGGKGAIDENTEESVESLLPSLLQETNYPVKVTVYDEKKSLNEALLEILKHSSTASGALSTPYTGADGIKKLIEAGVMAQQLARFLTREDVRQAVGIGDFEKLAKEMESGYDNSAPLRAEIQSPYNEPIAQRPRVKRVSKKRKK